MALGKCCPGNADYSADTPRSGFLGGDAIKVPRLTMNHFVNYQHGADEETPSNDSEGAEKFVTDR